MCLYVCKCQRKRLNILLYLTPFHPPETESSLNLELCCQPASPSDSSLSNSTVRGFRPMFSRFLFFTQGCKFRLLCLSSKYPCLLSYLPSPLSSLCGRIVSDNYWLTSLSQWSKDFDAPWSRHGKHSKGNHMLYTQSKNFQEGQYLWGIFRHHHVFDRWMIKINLNVMRLAFYRKHLKIVSCRDLGSAEIYRTSLGQNSEQEK